MQTSQEIVKTITALLDDMKANDIKLLNVKEQTSVTDYMLVCTGRSSRHVKAIADDIIEKMKEKGIKPLSQTGLESGDWALVDFGDVVLHVFQPETRAFYNIEGLWQESSS